MVLEDLGSHSCQLAKKKRAVLCLSLLARFLALSRSFSKRFFFFLLCSPCYVGLRIGRIVHEFTLTLYAMSMCGVCNTGTYHKN